MKSEKYASSYAWLCCTHLVFVIVRKDVVTRCRIDEEGWREGVARSPRQHIVGLRASAVSWKVGLAKLPDEEAVVGKVEKLQV